MSETYLSSLRWSGRGKWRADGGSTYLLPRMIGRARAMEMMLPGERVSAKQALEWGLINRVYRGRRPDAHDLKRTNLVLDCRLGATSSLAWD